MASDSRNSRKVKHDESNSLSKNSPSTRKSKRLEKQKLGTTVRRKSARIEKQRTPNPTRMSERGKIHLVSTASGSRTSEKSLNSMPLKQKNGQIKNSSLLTSGTRLGKVARHVKVKNNSIRDARAYRKLMKKRKKLAEVAGNLVP